MANRVLIVAAHPDDEILGCGGFIAKHRARCSIKVVFLAEGITARYPADQVTSPEAVKGVASRTACAIKALETLGIEDMTFHDLVCGRLDQVPILDINKIIEGELAQYRPDVVFTHPGHDVNNDHAIVYRSMLMATRPGGLHQIPTVFCFETLSSTEWNFGAPFAPNHYEVISEQQLELKCKALECYESEIRAYPHSRSREGLETLARFRGIQAGHAYAEAYQLFRTIVI